MVKQSRIIIDPFQLSLIFWGKNTGATIQQQQKRPSAKLHVDGATTLSTITLSTTTLYSLPLCQVSKICPYVKCHYVECRGAM